MSHKKSTALMIVADGVEELEATAPVDVLRRAEVEVTVAAAADSRRVKGRNGLALEADMLLEEASGQVYDLIVVPGGPGHKALLENTLVHELLQRQNREGKWIGSICAGPTVLKRAGILEGKRFTSFPATAEILPERVPDEPVVVDGKLITSQAAGTAILFGLALVEALCGPEKRAEIAESICHPQD